MKHSRFNFGTCMVAQLVRNFTDQQVSNAVIPATKQKEDSIISSKFLKIFAVVAVIKIIVFFILL